MLRLLRIRILLQDAFFGFRSGCCVRICIHGDTNLLNMMVCNPRDLHMQAFKVKRSAGIGEPSELLHDPAADGGHIRVGFQTEIICKIDIKKGLYVFFI